MITPRFHHLLSALGGVAIATATLSAQPAPSRGPQPAGAAQPTVQVIDLPSSVARTSEKLGAILGLKQAKDGHVLVNDAGRRQIKLYDSTLSAYVLVSDSIAGLPNSYGRVQVPFLEWLGDSSLFLDFESQALLVLDGRGEVKRTIALPGGGGRGGMASFMRPGGSADAKGRLLYRASTTTTVRMGDGGGATSITQAGDSAVVLRFNMETRMIDTIGRVAQLASGLSSVTMPDGSARMKRTINPLHIIDEWAVLSDGTVAFVRGHDYHVDWFMPDGSRRSTVKLPFDWKRLTDADKQKLVDSAKTADSARTLQMAQNATRAPGAVGGDGAGGGGLVAAGAARGGGRGGGDGGGGPPGPPPPPPIVEYAALNDIADYYPPIRAGAALADRDGNLWVLPTTSAQSRSGELVYDVLNPRDALFLRVRIPAGRSIAGFGRNGVVFLMSGTRADGFTLEKAVLPLSVRRTTHF